MDKEREERRVSSKIRTLLRSKMSVTDIAEKLYIDGEIANIRVMTSIIQEMKNHMELEEQEKNESIPDNSRFSNNQLLGESKEALVSMIRSLERQLEQSKKQESKTDDKLGDILEALRNSRYAEKVIDQIVSDYE